MGRAGSPAGWMLVGAAAFLVAAGPLLADGPADGPAYQTEIRPLLRRFCHECHAGDRVEADLDLEAFATWDEARRHTRAWQKVGVMLDGGQMPPRDARQPTDAERSRLRGWVRDFLTAEALAHAGDPGRVVLRRLGNAEYTYTLRDLTGIEDLEPAREFPADGAAGEGFTNAGNALVMSPALVTKYLDAAKAVAARAVLLPDGFRFSRQATPGDWADEALAKVRDFYRAYTDPRGGATVNIQGLVFETNQGGRLPLEKYLAATLSLRNAPAHDPSAIAAVAREHGLSAKYVGTLWRLLAEEARPSPLLDGLRRRWKAAGPGDVATLAAEVEGWQKALWRFNSVGHIGKVGGPKAWMEPVSPIVARQEIRHKLPAAPDGGDVVLRLAVGDAGDGDDGDLAVWERPRLVVPGRSDLLLRDVRAVGLDPARFGTRPGGPAIDGEGLGMRAPEVIEVRLPAELAAGAEFVATGFLLGEAGREGSVQFRVLAAGEADAPGLHPSAIVVAEGSAARRRFEGALEEHRRVFPPALCYGRVVPVDEAVTLTLHHREDEPLRRLMLDDEEAARLDRLWAELRFIGQDDLKIVDAFAQILEYASQDGDPSVFEPMRRPILDRASAFRRQLLDAEPAHLDALLRFAALAYRRPPSGDEARDLRALYGRLRAQEIPHDEAFRLTMARVLVAPAFLYRAETPAPGAGPGPASDWEMAVRLSYFLWSSPPDAELREAAAAGRLRDPEVVATQARRMLRDPRTRRLATEFACQWLQIYEFDQLDEKSERHFPTFSTLRGAMYEESVRFLADLFQNDRSVLGLLDADYTFLNGDLAAHYEIPGVAGPEWRRVEGVKRLGRGGILAQATTLAKQSGASRTSPTLRGNWVSEVLLGERLPRPPKGVPQLPDDEASTEGLTVRQLVEKHAGDPKCATCHARIDPLGFALEGFDPVGRLRAKDLGDRPVDARAVAADGTPFEGLAGLRDHLLTARRDAFVRQFCRKLLGYALGRSVQLSDEPLLAEMRGALEAHDFATASAVEMVVRSRPFRELRGRDAAEDYE